MNAQYSVMLYLNMARLINAENELNELMKSSQKLLVTVNFLRMQIVCQVVWCCKAWINKYRKQKERLEKAKKQKEKDKELLLNNMMGMSNY